MRSILTLALLLFAAGPGPRAADDSPQSRAAQFERAVAASNRLLHAWLADADPRTLLLPDRPTAPASERTYTPHNSGADLYPYLILTAELTDPVLYRGRLVEMLRNEIRYTTVEDSVPGNLRFAKGVPDGASLFGAGEYAKDGLISVTEYLGRGPWFARMVDMTADAMRHAPVASRFGDLPADDAELNGDYLQSLVRLATMTGDQRFLEWARRIADAYIEEVLPGNGGVPASRWNFTTHSGDGHLRLRDHGNETVVGLTMLFTLEHALQTRRAGRYAPVIQQMLDRILASANGDGLLYNEIDARTLRPLDEHLSDNWGYVYGAVYAFYQATGDVRYRDAVRRVLTALPKYGRYVWEPREGLPLGSFDGYADSIESAIYLVNREPVAQAFDWIDSETDVMLAMQRADGHIEDWYGEGNFNRTLLLYAYLKSQGVRPDVWEPGIGVGATSEDGRLSLHLEMPAARRIRFDWARHRRSLNLSKNYVRLNEFPEWFAVDENTLYRLRGPSDADWVRLGSEMIAGLELAPGNWTIESMGPPPYSR
jgi:hypothetical protein